jgi:hypothetical protein
MQKKLDYEKFFSELNIKNDLKIEEDLGNGFVRLKISEAERRQALQDINCVEDIVVELLRNSRDAGSRNIFLATKKIADKKRLIYCIDDGTGIPEIFHDLIFQSRVTSKLEDGVKDPYGFHGRGMALFSVKLNVDDIKITYSDSQRGTCIYIEIDIGKIPEKKDQSMMPQVIENEGSLSITGGVRNIIRTIAEFAIENDDINIYLGSPTQVISTIRQTYKNVFREAAKKLEDVKEIKDFFKTSNLKLVELLSLTDNYNSLGQLLIEYFNMDISDRGLQRITYNEIDALKTVDSMFSGIEHTGNGSLSAEEKKSGKPPEQKLKLYDELKLSNRFKDEEISYIIGVLEKEIEKLGSKYFITVEDDIEFKRSNNTIDIRINLKQKD